MLGHEVRDRVSGFTGVAVAKHTYLNGCTRVTVQPKIDGSSKLPDSETFDEPQLEILPGSAIRGKNDTGGPEKYIDVRRY